MIKQEKDFKQKEPDNNQQGKSMSNKKEWTRRAVLRFAWGGVLTAGVISISPVFKYLSSDIDRQKSPLVYYKNPEIDSIWRIIPNSRVWIRKDDLGVMALLATCTHLGCEVHFLKDKNEWHCPCHGSIYNPEGSPLSGPAQKALTRVAVDIKPDGSLLINTSKSVGMDARAK